MTEQSRRVLFSGIQPSGHLTIGHYTGALRNWVRLQNEYDCLFCIVDLHAITVRQDPQTFADRCLSFLAQYLALGIDPNTATIFLQSHVPAHTQLAWMLNCNAYMGELSRMTQFKAKTEGKTERNIGVGLFDYPVLMAADILLYQTALVPVGADQKQHLELTRDIAIRMNHLYGKDLFVVPEGFIPDVGARIMSLQEPDKKMSKSDTNEGNYLSLLDPPDVLRKKVRRAVTDSEPEITFAPDTRPGVANLLTIYGALSNEQPQQVAERFTGKGNAELKNEVADVVIAFLQPFQERYQALMSDRPYLNDLLALGAARAIQRGEPTLQNVYARLGFLTR